MGIRGKNRARKPRGGGRGRDGALRSVPLAALAALVLALAALPATADAFSPLLGPVSATPTSSGATLRATIYPYGLDTHYRFEYGTTTGYGTSVPVPEGDAGSAPYPQTVQEQATIAGLTSGATYHYRLLATNSDGSAASGDRQFTTGATPPTVSDEAVSEVVGGFELKGSVDPNGSATSYQFEYGTTANYGSKIPASAASVGSGNGAVAVSQTIASPLPNTTYHFRLVARNAGNVAMTADRSFTTPPAPPSAPAAEVEPPEAIPGGFRLKGAVNPDSLATGYHFEFGTTTLYGMNLPEPDATIGSGSSAVEVTQDVTGLSPNTTYHYRIVSSNSEGPGVSPDETFTTPPLQPTVASLPVSASEAGFMLNGTVNPNGGATTYHFEFGITEMYGLSVPVSEVSVGSGTADVSVSQLVAGLPPNVPYHYRLVAHNAGGTAFGEDEFFLTPSEPGAEQPDGGSALLAPPLPSPAPLSMAPPPSNAFTVRTGAAKAGKATLSLKLPGPGTVSVSGSGIRAVHTAVRGGPTSLKLKLTAAGRRAVSRAHAHRLKVRLTIVFEPAGDSPATTHKTIVFR